VRPFAGASRLVRKHARSVCDVRRPVQNWEAPEATGDTTVATGVPFLIRPVPVQPRDRPMPGQQYVVVTQWRLTSPDTVDVRPADRIIERRDGQDVRTFEVLGTMTPRTYYLGTDVSCIEIRYGAQA
jgi:hypothetical protein